MEYDQKSFTKHKFNEKDRNMVGESSFVQLIIPKFDRHYDRWSILIENFL